MHGPTRHRFSLVLELARKNSNFVTTETLARNGIPQSTATYWCRVGLLHRVQRGIYRTNAGTFGFEEALDLSMIVASAQQAVGMKSALRLWELPGGGESKIQIIGPRGTRSKSKYIVASETRDLRSVDLTTHRGIRVTTPLRSILDAAPYCSDELIGQQLSAATDARHFTYHDIRLRIAEISRRGKRGPAKVRKILRTRVPEDGRPLDSYEKIALRVFTRAGFPPPIPQLRIDVGSRTYYVDFAWPQFGVFVECDSMLAHSTPEQLKNDLRRQNDLVSAGWTPVRFTYWDVTEQPDDVVGQLERHLPRHDPIPASVAPTLLTQRTPVPHQTHTGVQNANNAHVTDASSRFTSQDS